MHISLSAEIVSSLEGILDELRYWGDASNHDDGFERAVIDFREVMVCLVREVDGLKQIAPNVLLLGAPLGENNHQPVRTLHAALDFVVAWANGCTACDGSIDDRCMDLDGAADILDAAMDRLTRCRWFREGAAAEAGAHFGMGIEWVGHSEPEAARINATA